VLRSAVVCGCYAPSISSPPRAGVRASSHTQAPLLGVGLHRSFGLHCAGPDVALPCLALSASRSSPSIIRGYFYPLLAGRCFWGDSGEATPNPLFTLRSPKRYPAKREQLQGMAKGLGMECTCSSSRSQSSRNPGTTGSAAQPAARPGSGSPEESLASGAPSLAGFCGCSRSARMILWVLTLAFALCSHISLYFIEMQLPTATQGLIPGIPS